METIMKIPFLSAILAALLTGLLCISNNKSTNQTCVSMIIAMVSFYFIGTLLSSTLSSIVEEQNKIKLKAEEEKFENERLEKEKALKEKQEEHLGANLDLVADNKLDDDFSPLDLSQAIRTKVNQ